MFQILYKKNLSGINDFTPTYLLILGHGIVGATSDSRGRGRPRRISIHDIEYRTGMKINNATESTGDRRQWSELVHRVTNPSKRDGTCMTSFDIFRSSILVHLSEHRIPCPLIKSASPASLQQEAAVL